MILYNFFVRKNKHVQYEYERYVMEHLEDHYGNRLKHWKILWSLNVHYRIKKKTEPMIYFDEAPNTSNFNDAKKDNYTVKENNEVLDSESKDSVAVVQEEKRDCKNELVSESETFRRSKPYHFVLDILKYDVISFDIFDTLLLRPFQKPTDVFNIIGKRLDYPAVFTGFVKGRIDSEKQARNLREQTTGNREINIYEIYEQMSQKMGVDKELGVKTEIETEADYLFANPYMKVVFDILRSQGKTIVLTSDMYIPGEIMEKLVRKNGYDGFEKVYVSCDYRCNKISGELYRRVINDYPDKKIVHIGDNPKADIDGAKKAGLDTRYYRNVNDIGNDYRGSWMSELTGSAYSGLVNAYIHNGLNEYPFFYEYGFIYGGIYILGFCEWIEKRAKEENIDKVIFLSRDGDIYQKVYNKYYGTIPTDYIFWSRFANLKYLIEINQDAFIDRVINQKALGTLDVELGSIFKSMSIQVDEKKLKEYGLYLDSILSSYNRGAVEHFIRDNWDSISKSYEEEKLLVLEDVKLLLGDAKRIAVIDVGWTASGPLGFKTFVDEHVPDKYEIKCWMAGGAGGYGSGNSVLPFYMDGSVESYLFSPFHNKRNAQIHTTENVAVTNNAVFELFTQAQYPSFRGRNRDGGYEFDIPENENFKIIGQIQKGIMDFCELYRKTFAKDKYLYYISGFDAYRPFAYLAFHKSFFEKNFKNVINGYGLSGDNDNQCIETIGQRMEHFYAHNGGKK